MDVGKNVAVFEIKISLRFLAKRSIISSSYIRFIDLCLQEKFLIRCTLKLIAFIFRLLASVLSKLNREEESGYLVRCSIKLFQRIIDDPV